MSNAFIIILFRAANSAGMLILMAIICLEAAKCLYYGAGIGLKKIQALKPQTTCHLVIPSPSSSPPPPLSYDSSTSSQSDDDSVPAITHTVIYKCIGAHKEKHYQEILAIAGRKHENGIKVPVKLQPEPQNKYDNTAIAFVCTLKKHSTSSVVLARRCSAGILCSVLYLLHSLDSIFATRAINISLLNPLTPLIFL